MAGRCFTRLYRRQYWQLYQCGSSSPPIMLQRQWALEHQQPSQHTETTLIQGDTFNLATPRSHCPKCGEQLRILDNLPLLSWLLLRGRCRFCQEAIAARYPLVELSAVLLGLAVVGVYIFRAKPFLLRLVTLLTLLLIDYDTGLLPDPITQPLLGQVCLRTSSTHSCPCRMPYWAL